MLIYLIALIFIAIFLFGVVRLHLSLTAKGKRNAPQASHPPLLRDLILQDLAE